MRKLFMLVLLTAAFLAGFYLGRKPDSPDIMGTARNICVKVATEAKDAADRMGLFAKNSSDPSDDRRSDPFLDRQ